MGILEGADVEISNFEIDNPVLSEFATDTISKIDVLNVCEYLGINDNNFNGSLETIEKVIGLVGKEQAMEKIQSVVSELGFRPGVIDEVYSRLMLDREIKRTTGNLDNLLKQKYGNSSEIQI